jgi:hypothetical protein
MGRSVKLKTPLQLLAGQENVAFILSPMNFHDVILNYKDKIKSSRACRRPGYDAVWLF